MNRELFSVGKEEEEEEEEIMVDHWIRLNWGVWEGCESCWIMFEEKKNLFGFFALPAISLSIMMNITLFRYTYRYLTGLSRGFRRSACKTSDL